MWRVAIALVGIVGLGGCALIDAVKNKPTDLMDCGNNGMAMGQSFELADITEPPEVFGIGDFDGDGKVDFATVANGMLQGAYGLGGLGQGPGHLVLGPKVAIGAGQAVDLAVADFDRDGIDDVALLVGTQVVLLMGHANRTFTVAATFTSLPAVAIAAGTFHDPQLGPVPTVAFVGDAPSMTMHLALWTGGGFVERTNEGLSHPVSVAFGDVDGDAMPEIAVSHDGGIDFHAGDGSPDDLPNSIETSSPSPQVLIGPHQGAFTVAPGGDGTVITREVYANGGFTRTAHVIMSGGISQHGLARVADFDGDGHEDVYMPGFQHNGAGSVTNGFLALGLDGPNACLSFPGTGSGQALHFAAIGDLNKDGVTDLAVADEGGGVTAFLFH